jgi:YD repeat-containing protein
VTNTITTNPKGFKATNFRDPLSGQPLRAYDANLKKTELVYDALGRLTQVWLPNRDRGSESAAFGLDTKVAYHLSDSDAPRVSTAVLKRDGTSYATSYAVYDSLLRPLQSQSETATGGHVLTDTRYDTRPGLRAHNAILSGCAARACPV